MCSWRHFRLGAAQLPAPETVKPLSPAGTLLPGSGAGGTRRKGAGRARISTRRRFEALTSEPGPFIWRTSRTAMTPIALD
jgi:hypothetical protein